MVSLAGAATSIIFVATNTRFVAAKHVFGREKSMLVATKLVLRQTRDTQFTIFNLFVCVFALLVKDFSVRVHSSILQSFSRLIS